MRAERKEKSEEEAGNFNLIFIVLLVIIGVVLIIVYTIVITNLKALKKAQKETADTNWNLAGSGELVKDMQGNKQVTNWLKL